MYGPSYFYPIPWQEGSKYFEPGNLQNNFSYGYHFWNTHTKVLEVSNTSTFAQVARKCCPFIHYLNKEKFGVLDTSTDDSYNNENFEDMSKVILNLTY